MGVELPDGDEAIATIVVRIENGDIAELDEWQGVALMMWLAGHRWELAEC